MIDIDPPNPIGRAAYAATLSTYLSLFLLLLGFFILLQAQTQYGRPPVVSVQAPPPPTVIESPLPPAVVPPSPLDSVPRSTDALSPEAFTEAARDLMTSTLPLVDGASAASDDLLAITLPSEALTGADAVVPRVDLAPFIDRLAVLLQRRPTGQLFQFAYRAGDDGPRSIARAAAFAAALSARGCPTDALSISVEKALGDRIHLSFRLAQAILPHRALPAPVAAPPAPAVGIQGANQ